MKKNEKLSDIQRKKISSAVTKSKDNEKVSKQKIIQRIQKESKEQFYPALKKKMEETTNYIIKLLEKDGEEKISNIQIMSLIARSSLINIAVANNMIYTPQEILAGFNLYLEMINKINEIKKFPPTIESFTTFLGISRVTYNNWLIDAEKRSVMEYIHSYLLGVLATGGLTGELKEISSMFLQKTMGKVEQQQPVMIKHEIRNNLDDIQNQLKALKKDKIIEVEYIEQEKET
ncbi:MAG: hypothetical protein IJN13_00360 [Bacilli bacterium]|nr:hypothetical protein [Bacilli bacterium]